MVWLKKVLKEFEALQTVAVQKTEKNPNKKAKPNKIKSEGASSEKKQKKNKQDGDKLKFIAETAIQHKSQRKEPEEKER